MKTNLNIQSGVHNRIKESIFQLLYSEYPFYSYFATKVNYIKSEEIKTCAVNISKRGMNFYYNVEFIENLSQEEFNFIVIHEIFHLLFRHHKRTKRSGYEHKNSNIVQDAIINSTIVSDIIRNKHKRNNKVIQIPKDKEGKNIGIYVPKEYKGKYIFEDLYNWFENLDEEKYNEESTQEIEVNGKEVSVSKYGEYGKDISEAPIECYKLNKKTDYCSMVGDHISDEDDLSPDVKERIIQEALDSSLENLKNLKGDQSLNETIQTLNKIRKPKKDYLKSIKRGLSVIMGGNNKRKTIVKPNRKNIKGLKGNKREKNNIIVILDTSGSMKDEFEKSLSYIFQRNLSIRLIQCDTSVQDNENINNHRDLKKVRIKGLGGTVLQPAIDYLVENKIKGNLLILTDGLTDVLDFKDFKYKSLIISNNKNCPIKNDGKKVKQIIVKDD